MATSIGSIFTGSSPGLSSSINGAQGLAGFGTNNGENNETAASNYYNGILSGDPAKIAQTLAPELSTNQQQTQQQKQTMAQFGSRSGGNTGAANAADSASRANVVNLIGGAQQGAAAGEAGLGENQVNSATQNNMNAGQLSEEALKNSQNSILGGLAGGLGGNLSTIFGNTLGQIPGLTNVI